MATQEFEPPTIAPAGEPCPGCGASLAGDQRYCLQCGTRRGDARLPFRDALAGRPAGGYTERVTERYTPETPPERTGLTFLAGLACLLLALGVGVLIGRSGQTSSTPAKAVAPQVIQVGGGATAATTPTTADSAAAATPAKAKKAKKAKKAARSAATAKSAKASKATNKKLKSLSNLSGSAYQKKAAKLPKQVGTGGKPPPIDKSKPAGGGSAVESIG